VTLFSVNNMTWDHRLDLVVAVSVTSVTSSQPSLVVVNNAVLAPEWNAAKMLSFVLRLILQMSSSGFIKTLTSILQWCVKHALVRAVSQEHH
jgi:hypothetical protein